MISIFVIATKSVFYLLVIGRSILTNPISAVIEVNDCAAVSEVSLIFSFNSRGLGQVARANHCGVSDISQESAKDGSQGSYIIIRYGSCHRTENDAKHTFWNGTGGVLQVSGHVGSSHDTGDGWEEDSHHFEKGGSFSASVGVVVGGKEIVDKHLTYD